MRTTVRNPSDRIPEQSVRCAIDGCDKEPKTRGYCPQHYQQGRKDGSITVRRYQTHSLTGARTCSIDGCDECPSSRGYCLKHYRRWWYYGDATYERPPRPTRSPRLPKNINNAAELGRILGVSRQRAHQLLTMDKTRARNTVRQAIKAGVISPPPFCVGCGASDQVLHAHHWDYERPLDVGWFCAKCHMALHARLRRETRRKAAANG